MRTVSIFRNNANQAIRIPKDLEYQGVVELEIRRDGDTLILRPVRPTWGSFASLESADPDFLSERTPVVAPERRFELSDDDLGVKAGPSTS
ncbi:type II toxin-antitoxin system VapB family antitoxin [Burkholderia sp. 22PA0099]|uniref:type II toxin-antitoxin system VapB family antitoxin n=1 Tax=Burkholderia sp. 22PA0099 TaxID=3237372 RepID=UPI0039C4A683